MRLRGQARPTIVLRNTQIQRNGTVEMPICVSKEQKRLEVEGVGCFRWSRGAGRREPGFAGSIGVLRRARAQRRSKDHDIVFPPQS